MPFKQSVRLWHAHGLCCCFIAWHGWGYGPQHCISPRSLDGRNPVPRKAWFASLFIFVHVVPFVRVFIISLKPCVTTPSGIKCLKIEAADHYLVTFPCFFIISYLAKSNAGHAICLFRFQMALKRCCEMRGSMPKSSVVPRLLPYYSFLSATQPRLPVSTLIYLHVSSHRQGSFNDIIPILMPYHLSVLVPSNRPFHVTKHSIPSLKQNLHEKKERKNCAVPSYAMQTPCCPKKCQ